MTKIGYRIKKKSCTMNIFASIIDNILLLSKMLLQKYLRALLTPNLRRQPLFSHYQMKVRGNCNNFCITCFHKVFIHQKILTTMCENSMKKLGASLQVQTSFNALRNFHNWKNGRTTLDIYLQSLIKFKLLS